jgi:cell division protein FtsW (lipid II flippase)
MRLSDRVLNAASLTLYGLSVVAAGATVYLQNMRSIGKGSAPQFAIPSAVAVGLMAVFMAVIIWRLSRPVWRLVWAIIILAVSVVSAVSMMNR